MKLMIDSSVLASLTEGLEYDVLFKCTKPEEDEWVSYIVDDEGDTVLINSLIFSHTYFSVYR